VPTVLKSGSLKLLEPSGLVQGLLYLFYYGPKTPFSYTALLFKTWPEIRTITPRSQKMILPDMVGGHIHRVTALQLAKNDWYPPLSRLSGPPIVSRTSEEKNVNTPTFWNMSNMTRYELVKSYDLLSRSKFRP